MHFHKVVKLLQSIIVRLCSNIEHESELGLEILAYRLEEPSVRIDLSIIPLFDAEHEIDSAAL